MNHAIPSPSDVPTVLGIPCYLKNPGAREAVRQVLLQIEKQSPQDLARLQTLVIDFRPLSPDEIAQGVRGEWRPDESTHDESADPNSFNHESAHHESFNHDSANENPVTILPVTGKTAATAGKPKRGIDVRGRILLDETLPLRDLVDIVSQGLGQACTRDADLQRRGDVPFEEWRVMLCADSYAARWGFQRSRAAALPSRAFTPFRPLPGDEIEIEKDNGHTRYLVTSNFCLRRLEAPSTEALSSKEGEILTRSKNSIQPQTQTQLRFWDQEPLQTEVYPLEKRVLTTKTEGDHRISSTWEVLIQGSGESAGRAGAGRRVLLRPHSIDTGFYRCLFQIATQLATPRTAQLATQLTPPPSPLPASQANIIEPMGEPSPAATAAKAEKSHQQEEPVRKNKQKNTALNHDLTNEINHDPNRELRPEWAAFLQASRELAQTARARRRGVVGRGAIGPASRFEADLLDLFDQRTREARVTRALSTQAGQNPFNGRGEWRHVAPTPHPLDGRYDFVCGDTRGNFRRAFAPPALKPDGGFKIWRIG